jgi:hypothetical protein
VEKKILPKKPGLVIPPEWGHPVIMRGEVEVRKIGGKKVVFPIRSFSRWAHRFLMNQVLSNCTHTAPFTYTHLPIKNINGNLNNWNETAEITPCDFHFHKYIAVGSSNQAWNYDDYNLISLKDWAASYNRRLDTTETDGSIKAEFQGTVQASDNYDICEVGLYGNAVTTDKNNVTFLVSRDVLPSPISVAQNDVVVVYYRLTVGGT